MSTSPSSATLNQKKLRQPTCWAIGPAIIGPTYTTSQRGSLTAYFVSYHERAEIKREVECVEGISFVQKYGVCNDLRLRCLPLSVSLTYASALGHQPRQGQLRIH